MLYAVTWVLGGRVCLCETDISASKLLVVDLVNGLIFVEV